MIFFMGGDFGFHVIYTFLVFWWCIFGCFSGMIVFGIHRRFEHHHKKVVLPMKIGR